MDVSSQNNREKKTRKMKWIEQLETIDKVHGGAKR